MVMDSNVVEPGQGADAAPRLLETGEMRTAVLGGDVTQGLSSGRGSADSTLIAALESHHACAGLPSRSRSSAASKSTSSQRSVWISFSRQSVSISNRMAAAGRSHSRMGQFHGTTELWMRFENSGGCRHLARHVPSGFRSNPVTI